MKRTLKPNSPFVLGTAFIAGLLCTSSAQAQLPWRIFGPKSVEKVPAPTKVVSPDSRRIAEVNVEVAWLADPITFPYYLEAHVSNSQLEMRGYVPNKTVRDQALRIAQVYSSLPVTDALKEHSSLLVRPSMMSPQQLQTSAQSSLRVALPKQSSQFKIECGADGKVSVAGPVNTYDEKIAVSHALRRLQGCTSVQNLTTLPAELAQLPPTLMVKERTPIVKVSNPGEEKSDKPLAVVPERPTEAKSRWLFWPFNKASTMKDEPPVLEPRMPMGPAFEIQVEMPAKSNAAAMTPTLLQKRILAVCKQAKGAEVQFTSASEVRITVEVRADKDVAPAAEVILAMPELQRYRPELLFKMVSP